MNTNKTIIGVSGGSGSGKTSFITQLRKKFDVKDVCLISLDEYYFPREQQKIDAGGKKNFDLPSSIDSKALKNDLNKLLSDQTVEKEEYVFNNKDKEPKILKFIPAPIILVEGLFIFHYADISKLLDYKIFIAANDDLKVIRRIKRDGLERNYPIDDVIYRYANHVKPSFEQYIEPYKDYADIIINNNDSFDKGLEILSGFITNLIK